MFDPLSYRFIKDIVFDASQNKSTHDQFMHHRLAANIDDIVSLFNQLYTTLSNKEHHLHSIVKCIVDAHHKRSDILKEADSLKINKPTNWYLDNKIVGMSLYVDRFAGGIKDLISKLDYLSDLGITFIHVMPIMQSPANESDGGYAVSDFRNVDARFGTIEDVELLRSAMRDRNMILMLDIVLNHTSYQHEWAQKASSGDEKYQDYYYMYDDRTMPDAFESAMPEVFPDSSPGSFTYDHKSGKWVMTVFHSYQWDLNFRNPAVLTEMLDNIFFYANLGVDILRIDAPAFIWKEPGTTSQNLPQAHLLLQLIKLCVQVATPGMALLGEAIVAPKEIMKYFGNGQYYGRECDVAYNATQMALLWDALATGDVRIMRGAQHDILQKPYGNTWINYTRCHDDIGLGYEDAVIAQAGFNPTEHRRFMKQYYSGQYPSSPARGALFGVNDKTDDARISGTLASLCGLESAIESKNENNINIAIDKIIMMQAFSILLGGIPMLFYGDEVGYTNDYSYLKDPGKSYDNRWMHRPIIDWAKNDRRKKKNTIENRIFTATKKLIKLRQSHDIFADINNLKWLPLVNNHVAGFVRIYNDVQYYILFNFGQQDAYVSWYMIKAFGLKEGSILSDVWSDIDYIIGKDDEYLKMRSYQVLVMRG